MSKQKMLAARELIQEKRYAEARALLKTIDDPKAKEWLKKLDAIAPEKKKSGGLLIYITAAFVLLSVVIIAVTLITRQNNAENANQNAVVQVPTQMDLPSVTPTYISVTTVSISTTPTASISSTVADDFQERLENSLSLYCFAPIDLMQALDIYEESQGNQLLFPQLMNADIHQLCDEWTQEILLTRYDAAAYCLRQADTEYREATFFECIDARNFHLGNILGEGWAATASEILELDQSVKASLGFPPYTDFRTWGDQVQISEIRIGSTVVVAAAEGGINVRSGANLDRSILFVAVDGSIFVVEDGPAQSNGLTWWKIRDPQNSSHFGWVPSDYLDVQTNCPQPAGWVTYTVEVGDSMGLLAEQTDSSIAELTQANCLKNADEIYVGLVLYVPRQP